MKMLLLTLSILGAQIAHAATLQCVVYESSKKAAPVSFSQPLSNHVGDTAEYALGALNGTEVFASTISYGNEFPEMAGDVRIYVKVNGLRIDGNKAILLAAPNKDVFEARCSIEK